MKGDNTFVQNQYGQDQVHPQQPAGYNDSTRAYGQQPSYGAVGNMGGHAQQPHVAGGSNQPIYVVDGHQNQNRGGDNCEFWRRWRLSH